jgi:heme A synthase
MMSRFFRLERGEADAANEPAPTDARPAPGASSREVAVNWNKWIRQFHRWVSIAFTVSVIATFVALAQEKPVVWVSYVPLLPLALLLLTGLYLFALPYAAEWRRRRGADRKHEAVASPE